MSGGKAQDFGFGNLASGFDFFQNLGRSLPQVPGLASWVAPTLNIEELDKRISDLKAVQFWLDQNGKALAATVQALEVQRMTLATLKNMNLQVNDLAEALKVKPAADADAPTAGAVDPLLWWNALTQQFQHIAATSLQDVTRQAAAGAAAAAVPPQAAPAGRKARARRASSARRPARTNRNKPAGAA